MSQMYSSCSPSSLRITFNNSYHSSQLIENWIVGYQTVLYHHIYYIYYSKKNRKVVFAEIFPTCC